MVLFCGRTHWEKHDTSLSSDRVFLSFFSPRTPPPNDTGGNKRDCNLSASFVISNCLFDCGTPITGWSIAPILSPPQLQLEECWTFQILFRSDMGKIQRRRPSNYEEEGKTHTNAILSLDLFSSSLHTEQLLPPGGFYNHKLNIAHWIAPAFMGGNRSVVISRRGNKSLSTPSLCIMLLLDISAAARGSIVHNAALIYGTFIWSLTLIVVVDYSIHRVQIFYVPLFILLSR